MRLYSPFFTASKDYRLYMKYQAHEAKHAKLVLQLVISKRYKCLDFSYVIE